MTLVIVLRRVCRESRTDSLHYLSVCESRILCRNITHNEVMMDLWYPRERLLFQLSFTRRFIQDTFFFFTLMIR